MKQNQADMICGKSIELSWLHFCSIMPQKKKEKEKTKRD